jgi:hypothetical protein
MLNLAGSEYDFAQVVYAVLTECEHRRRSLPAESNGSEFREMAQRKLLEIKPAYDELGGSSNYWQALEREVLETAIPQYAPAALQMNAVERRAFALFNGSEPAARGVYAVCAFLIGSVLVVALPAPPTMENTFALGLIAAGFFYPDIVRYTHDRRHAKLLNALVERAATFQSNARVVYMSNKELDDSFGPATQPRRIAEGDSSPRTE